MEIYIRSNIDLIKNMLAIGIEPMTNASPCIPCYWHKSATLPTELCELVKVFKEPANFCADTED